MQGPEEDAGLTGKVALISGGGAAGDGIGNGRAAAILLARSGTKVMVADRDLKLAERTVEMIRDEGGAAAAIAGDVTDEEDCRKLVDATVNQFGRLDFLDNNVGIGSRGSVVEEKPEQYRKVMQINVESMFLLSKYAIPAMIEDRQRRRDRQHLLDLGAAAARAHHLHHLEGGGHRPHARHGSRSRPRQHPRQLHLPGADVHADGLCPRHEREGARQPRTASVLKLEGTGWDVGHAVKFLFSNFARYITGQVLVVDGGVTLQAPERESEEH